MLAFVKKNLTFISIFFSPGNAKKLLTLLNTVLIIFVMDWKKIISELSDAGLTQTQIGTAIDKSQAWVSAVANGKYKDISWDDGETLLALHSSFFCDDDAPRPASASITHSAKSLYLRRRSSKIR